MIIEALPGEKQWVCEGLAVSKIFLLRESTGDVLVASTLSWLLGEIAIDESEVLVDVVGMTFGPNAGLFETVRTYESSSTLLLEGAEFASDAFGERWGKPLTPYLV